ncbi:BnaA02g30640D [Brassica napus]|uniref:BnaA02g30640D protein n=1 Tax=Brassica napus TaxID=3708 RepID=A0A078HAQ6_BRANA|nr:BnaA02g30640D [Brassica napus]
MIDLKHRHCVSEFAVVRNRVDKMKVTSFFIKG